MNNCLSQTIEEIVTEIAISQDTTPWLIIEGINDERFFKTKNIPKKPKKIVAYGWANVVSIISKVTEENISTSVIGFIDRDHREDIGITTDFDNIVLTDYRDIEISMFESGALHRILVEFGSDNKLPKLSCGTIDIDAVKIRIYSVAEALGRLRFYSLKNNLNIAFKKLDYYKFIDKQTLLINQDRLVSQINSKSDSKITIEVYSESQNMILPERLTDSRNLSSGHDVIETLGISLRKIWGTNCTTKICREKLEANFRIGYSEEEFKVSLMYKNLCSLLES